mmetsp:Transcript_2325/g.7271  ORF Transcript_2325/g.7271 Transcript_2325/m.7271 type:complete len:202 (+) Transcript_2325:1229-1834(+)
MHAHRAPCMAPSWCPTPPTASRTRCWASIASHPRSTSTQTRGPACPPQRNRRRSRQCPPWPASPHPSWMAACLCRDRSSPPPRRPPGPKPCLLPPRNASPHQTGSRERSPWRWTLTTGPPWRTWTPKTFWLTSRRRPATWLACAQTRKTGQYRAAWWTGTMRALWACLPPQPAVVPRPLSRHSDRLSVPTGPHTTASGPAR